MSGIAGSILSGLKLAPRILFALWMFGAIVLFIPASYADQLGVEAFRTAYRQWIGVETLAAFVLWTTHIVLAVVGSLRTKSSARRRRKAVLAHLNDLSTEERFLLAYFVHAGAPTQHLPLNYSPARALESKGLLYATSGQGNMFDWPYTIPSFVWQELLSSCDELFPGIDSSQASEAFAKFPKHMRDRNLFAGL